MTADRIALRTQLVAHEGQRRFPYDDATGEPLKPGMLLTGNLTIGVGRNLSLVGLSELESMDLLDHDIDTATGILTRRYEWFLALDPIRQRVLIDLMFNLGPGTFGTFVRLIDDMRAGTFEPASREILASTAAKKAPDRYNVLAKMMATGRDVTWT